MPLRPVQSRTDARDNRDRVLEAAREVLAEQGVGAEIAEIAARAGVGTGTIYRNYATKEALVLEVARELANRTSLDMLAVAAHVDDPREAVASAMKIGFQRVSEYGRLAIELVAGTVPPAYAAVVNRQTLGNVFTLIIKRGVEVGVFRKNVDVEYVVAAWFALVAPTALSELMERRSLDEIADLTTDFLLASLVDGVADAPSDGD